MARCFIFIIVLLLVFNCTTNNTPNTMFKRSFKANTTEKFAIKKRIEQQHINYNYTKDSLPGFSISYLKNTNKLVYNLDTFSKINKRYTHQKLKFTMYQHKTDSTSIKTLVFNKKYGLLSIIGLANDAVFLKDSLSIFKNEAVFKAIVLALNKIDY